MEEVEGLTGRRPPLYVEGAASVTVLGGESVDIPAEGGDNVTVGGASSGSSTGDLPDDEGHRVALFGPRRGGGVLASSPLSSRSWSASS